MAVPDLDFSKINQQLKQPFVNPNQYQGLAKLIIYDYLESQSMTVHAGYEGTTLSLWIPCALIVFLLFFVKGRSLIIMTTWRFLGDLGSQPRIY